MPNLLKDLEVIEVSLVDKPAINRTFLMTKRASDIETKGVISYKRYPLAPENKEWDAGAEVRKADVEGLKKMCAWYDENNSDVKSSYKFPHHTADGYHTVWRAIANAMARLNQSNLSETDRAGVRNHLLKHYEDFGKEPPKGDKANLLDKIKNVFTGTKDNELSAAVKDQITNMGKEIDEVASRFKSLVKLIENERNGGDDIMNPEEIQKLVDDKLEEKVTEAVKSAAEIPEEEKKKLADKEKAEKEAQEKLVKSVEDISNSLKGIDTKINGLEERLTKVEGKKPDKKSMDPDADKDSKGKKKEESDSFNGVLFR